MDEARVIELLVELHQGLSRLGPGDDAATLRALAQCTSLPDRPTILDIGCGTGAQSLLLAGTTRGQVIATDLMPSFLLQLDQNAADRGVGRHVATCVADMGRLPFAPNSFDLAWSEGAVYLVGFDEGLTRWRALVRSGGWLVISELSWFTSDPPAELTDFWNENYPAMRTIEANLAAAREHEWNPVSHFRLPEEGWREGYYGPLKRRLPDFLEAHSADPEAEEVVAMVEREMELMTRHPESCGYAFYVLRRG